MTLVNCYHTTVTGADENGEKFQYVMGGWSVSKSDALIRIGEHAKSEGLVSWKFSDTTVAASNEPAELLGNTITYSGGPA
jgi:hypothetical protein